tara:strand:+ start:249 stop:503 length:255 start_codon:yes stop_codon:yes gene_type:complete
MAARLRNRHQDEIRKKIQVSQLINRLESYALGELPDTEVSPNRLNAIKILLGKTLPDLSATEVTQQVEGDVKVSVIELVAGVKS